MPDDRVLLIILLALTGILIGMFVNWMRRPARVRGWHIGILMAVLIPSYILFLVMRDQQASSSSDTAGPPLDMSAQQLLVYDSDAHLLFSVRLDGTNKQRVSHAPNGYMPTFVPGSTDLIYPIYDGAAESFRLEHRSITGDLLGLLTDFSAGREDTDPSIASNTGALYFQRTQYELFDDGTKALSDSTVMRMPLDGSAGPEPVETPIYISSATVDDNETLLAGLCPREEDTDTREVCVIDLARGSYERVPNSRFANDPEISPDGALVAFASFDFNPYGDEQIYVYDVAAGQTTMVSELPGFNGVPKWSPVRDERCVIFHHDETLKVGIYLACLDEDVTITEATSFGTFALWFQPA